MKYIKSFVLIELATMGIHSIAATQEERIEELERIALYEPSDWIDENEVIPTPDDAKKKFNLTDAQLFSDIKTLEKKYSISETNDEKRFCRKMAVSWIGGYGTTNDFPYLKNIMHNKNDYAQENAMRILIEKTKLTNLLLPLANEVVTNKNVFSLGLRRITYVTLAKMCNGNSTNTYINSPQIRSDIATFFLERAALETDAPLYIDEVACELNPSYRHSQQRRDNLARVRNPKLSGHPADLYDAAQRDALPKEEEE
jgi:hypothetical protein